MSVVGGFRWSGGGADQWNKRSMVSIGDVRTTFDDLWGFDAVCVLPFAWRRVDSEKRYGEKRPIMLLEVSGLG